MSAEEVNEVKDIQNNTNGEEMPSEEKREPEDHEILESDTQPEQIQTLPVIEETKEGSDSDDEPPQTQPISDDEEEKEAVASDIEPEERLSKASDELVGEEEYSKFITEDDDVLPEGDFFAVESPALITITEGEEREEFVLGKIFGLTEPQKNKAEEGPIDVEEKITVEEAEGEGEKKPQMEEKLEAKKEEKEKKENKRKSTKVDLRGLTYLRKRNSQTSILSAVSIYKHGLLEYTKTPVQDVDDTFSRFSVDVRDFNIRLGGSIATMLDEYEDLWSSEESLDEEIEEELELEDTSILRPFLYEKHAEMLRQITNNRIINTLLQRRVAMYYRKKHMDYALQETDQHVDNVYSYNKRLDEYSDVLENKSNKTNLINSQIEALKNTKEKMKEQLQIGFTNLQNRERDIGTGLIYSKTGTEISDKLINQQLNRQKIGLMEVSAMRLKSLQIKSMVKEKESAIQVLDRVDADHHLNYYEKLKEENKMFSDKIEEKDVELTTLRIRCNENIQILAHLREKIAALDSDIEYLKETDQKNVEFLTDMRRSLNNTKKERDLYRSLLVKMQEDSGLLKERELLKDMENSIEEAQKLRNTLQSLKNACGSNIKKIRCIRKRIEERMDRPKHSLSYPPSKKSYMSTKITQDKTNPQVFVPILPKKAMDHLAQDFQPTVRRIIVNR
uniref:Coiled-coil domain-containing protein 96-like n=1 Tax=Diabrotica virgifera virgifera TaxID=50390 RepID=A0A6P7GA63_DIAVI